MQLTPQQAAQRLIDGLPVVVKNEELGEFKYKFVEIQGEPSYLSIFHPNGTYQQYTVGRADLHKTCIAGSHNPDVSFLAEYSLENLSRGESLHRVKIKRQLRILGCTTFDNQEATEVLQAMLTKLTNQN